MARLIDADALVRVFEILAKYEDISRRTVILGMTHTIKTQPTVDAVEVVRCRECKKISPSVTDVKSAVWCREVRSYMPTDGYCSCGERRESGCTIVKQL